MTTPDALTVLRELLDGMVDTSDAQFRRVVTYRAQAIIARLELEQADKSREQRLELALFVHDADSDGRPYVWCRACEGDWDDGALENHRPGCPLHQSPEDSKNDSEEP